MPRFVLLYHETPPGYERPAHWDLMIERGDGLRTWALADAPDAGRPIEATLLGDHRAEYLDYEGPISGDRGHVSRWDAGDCRIVREADDLLVAELRGTRLRGEATLRRTGGAADQWRFALEPVATLD